MKTACLLILSALAVHADFSYTTTRKSSASMPGGAGGDAITHHYLKGQKMMTDSNSFASIIDFESQTVTTLNKTQNTYTVRPFSEIGQAIKGADMDASIDVKETGQHRSINGHDATQVMMNMSIESQRPGSAGMKMQVEIENWISSDIPGADELRSFYKRNAEHFPWSAMMAAGNPSMQQSMAAAMRKLASLGGVPVLQIIRPKLGAGGPAGPNAQQSAQMQQGLAQAKARLEAMAQSGGPGAAMAQQQLARINAMSAGGSGGGGFETTMESSDFSTAPVPDSIFAIPPGFQKSAQ